MSRSNLMLVVCLGVFLLILWNISSRNDDTVLNPKDIVTFARARDFLPIDLILASPMIVGSADIPESNTNFTLLSVVRFAAWVRRIHIYDPHLASQSPQDPQARLVYFGEDLRRYCLICPLLSEHFLLLKPHHLLTNYVMPWFFFVNGRIVRESTESGLTAMSRSALVTVLAPDTRTSWSRLCKLAQGPFVSWPSPRSLHVLQLKRAAREELAAYLHYSEPTQDRSLPLSIVLVLMSDMDDDLRMYLPAEYDHSVQVWCLCSSADTRPQETLSWLNRMAAGRKVVVEVETQSHHELREKLQLMSHGNAYRVKHVFTCSAGNTWEGAAQELVRLYQCTLDVLLPSLPPDAEERYRLSLL
jgi:hypothetical protein